MSYLKPPVFLPHIFPGKVWRMPSETQSVYLSFDDGPYPDVSEKVLEILREHEAKASFFICGRQAEKHPDLVRKIFDEGHSVGSHSHSHPDAWKTSPPKWNEDVYKGHQILENILGNSVDLFRPPYGHFIPLVNKAPQTCHWIMWNLMPGDFDTTILAEDVILRTRMHLNAGDIIVLHDNPKSADRVLSALPEILNTCHQRNLQCKNIKI